MFKNTFFILLVASFWQCSVNMEAINFGTDNCSYCKMTIVDQRYGAEVVTKKGKVYKYDASECMIREVCQESQFTSDQIHSMYTIDFLNPKTLIDANQATFLFSKQLPSPMGAFLTSFASAALAQEKQNELGGELLDFQGVKNHIFKNGNCH